MNSDTGAVRLLPQIYQVGGAHLTHPLDASSYMIATDPSVLIDCGSPEGYTVLKHNLLTSGVPADQIRYLVGTHGHYDHLGAACQLKAFLEIELWLHAEDADAVEVGDAQRTCASVLYDAEFPTVRVDKQLGDEHRMQLGDVTITFLHTPGHTPGSMCVFVQHEGFGVLFAGDTLWGGYHPAIGSDIARWRASLERLEDLPVDVLVWGHSGCVLYADARERIREAREALGVYYVPWRAPMSGPDRYGGNPLAPGRVEYPAVAP